MSDKEKEIASLKVVRTIAHFITALFVGHSAVSVAAAIIYTPVFLIPGAASAFVAYLWNNVGNRCNTRIKELDTTDGKDA